MTNAPTSPTVAYFTMEAGLDPNMPTYSGGLGVLAGDTLRASADLGVPMVGVTLLYRQGFFRQHLDAEGNQTESPFEWDPATFLRPLDLKVSVELEEHSVFLTAWVFNVRGVGGREVPVYLLDADLPENQPEDRALTGQLYGGDQRYRLRQEALLGIGGIALLRSLGYDSIETYHMNEGHCSLLTLALLEEAATLRGHDVIDASPTEIAAVRELCCFTTHTPVPAGHDRFPLWLVGQVLGEHRVSALARLPFISDDLLNMTHLALFFSRFTNAVARRHAQTARDMYPGQSIFGITNGVHAATWVSDPVAAMFDREIPQWRFDNHALRQAIAINVEHLQEAHALAKRDLLLEVEKRTGTHLDPAVLTIGFARRAATYKRADLIFNDLPRLEAIARDGWPLQLLFAGKAHPADDPGKAIIHRIFEARDELGGQVPVVYLEEHDMTLGRMLCAGVDLWLNNPQKPLEASGTSGMKAALNGVPSLSILDGWWPEGWFEGVTGWSIDDNVAEDSNMEREAFSVYSKLRYVIAPLYYGSPTGYARVMRSTVAINGAYFTAQRMVEQYIANAYRARSEGRAYWTQTRVGG